VRNDHVRDWVAEDQEFTAEDRLKTFAAFPAVPAAEPQAEVSLPVAGDASGDGGYLGDASQGSALDAEPVQVHPFSVSAP
jgi:hypothetical protein